MSPHLMLMRYDARKSSTIVAFAYWLVGGVFGAHRAYLQDVLWPIMFTAHFVTLGLLYEPRLKALVPFPFPFQFLPSALVILWWVTDLLRLPHLVTTQNLDLAERLERDRLDAEKASKGGS